MSILYIALIIIILGIAYVTWLIWNEDKQPSQKDTPKAQGKGTDPLLQRLGLEKEDKKKSFNLNPFFRKKGLPQKAITPSGTAALKLEEPLAAVQPAPSNTELDQFDVLRKQQEELQAKYDKLDSLFQEKCVQLSQTELSLDKELKNRKDFNKVKDLLEKELKDSKEKYRDLKIEAANAKTEAEAHLKRIAQLEEKIAKTEKEGQLKEEERKKALADLETLTNQKTQIEHHVQNHDARLKDKDKKIGKLVDKLKDMASVVQPPAENIRPPIMQPEPDVKVKELEPRPVVPEKENSSPIIQPEPDVKIKELEPPPTVPEKADPSPGIEIKKPIVEQPKKTPSEETENKEKNEKSVS